MNEIGWIYDVMINYIPLMNECNTTTIGFAIINLGGDSQSLTDWLSSFVR